MSEAAEPGAIGGSGATGARRLLVCAFQSSPDGPADSVEQAVTRLAEQSWSPPAVAASYYFIPRDWSRALEGVADMMRATEAGAVLLVATARRSQDFVVEMRAQNRVTVIRPDASGRLLSRPRITPVGPAVARTTGPVADMLRAMAKTGLAAHASSDAGDYICNYVLYRLLTEVAADLGAPPVGCLRAPGLDAEGRPTDLDETLVDHVILGVKACASAVADFIPGSREPAEV